MSRTNTFDDTHPFQAASVRPHRSFGRWLQLEARALHIAWRRRQNRRAALMALEGMDDRLLRDIGIDRGHIRAAVDGER